MEIKGKQYILLNDLEIYQLARELSQIGWKIYQTLDWRIKKINGDQFIESTDSIGANITEGYGRFHYLDRIKFLYNARASLMECNEHWIELLSERGFVEKEQYEKFKNGAKKLSIKLNNFIASIYKTRSSTANINKYP